MDILDGSLLNCLHMRGHGVRVPAQKHVVHSGGQVRESIQEQGADGPRDGARCQSQPHHRGEYGRRHEHARGGE